MKQERVVVLAGLLRGQTFDVKGSLSIGRNPDSGLHLDDLQVSRRHAVIEQTAAGTIVRDLGSGNGTYIGERRILECRLSDGDVIAIGPAKLRFESAEVSDESAVEEPSGVRFEQDVAGTMQASSAENVYQTFFAASREAVSADRLRDTQAKLAAVYEANQIISSERDLRKLFGRVMDQIFALVPAHNGVILLKDEETGAPATSYVKSGSGSADVVISSTIVGRAFDNKEAVITYNAADDSRFGAGVSIIAQNISSVMCTPLIHQGEAVGVLYVDTRGTTNAFTQSDLELLVALAGPAAIAIKNAQYLQDLERAYHDTLIVTSNAIEMRDHYTVGHTWRVTNFALEMAREMGWSEERLKECEMGGLLHDVGKIAVDDAVLRKPSSLSDEERAKMEVHPERGARMMQDVKILHRLIPYCLYHHEHYDGKKGYPFGLAGEDIPIEGRLVAVADAFDAMTSNRPYRKGLHPEEAIERITQSAGTQFDPACAEALVNCYRAGKIDRILQDYLKTDEKSIACPFCSTHIRIPEGSKVGDEFQCTVCHRRVRLREENEAYYGELLAETPASTLTREADTATS